MTSPVSRFQNEISPVVYDELRRFAHRALDDEPESHRIQTTELVHETDVRLAKIDKIQWTDNDHRPIAGAVTGYREARLDDGTNLASS